MDIIYRVTVEHDGEVEAREFGSEAEARNYADARDKEIYLQYKEIDKNVCYRGKFKDGNKLAYKNEVHLYRLPDGCKSKIIYTKIDFNMLER